jgi:hypothetical protein
MVQKGKKVKRYKRYRFTDGDMTVKKKFFFDLQLGNMHSLRDVYCRKLLMKKKPFLGPFFFCTFLPFVPFYLFVPFSVLPFLRFKKADSCEPPST